MWRHLDPPAPRERAPRFPEVGARAAPLGASEPDAPIDPGDAPVSLASSRAAPGDVWTLVWRSDDARGSFTRRAVVALPAPTEDARWRVVVATRTGAQLERLPPAERLVWVDARGAHEIAADTPFLLDRPFAVARGDGGAVVLATDIGPEPSSGAPLIPVVVTALELSPAGLVERLRSVPSRAATGAAVGIGELDGRWGVALARGVDPYGLTLLTLDGSTLPFGRWDDRATTRWEYICPTSAARGPRLHVGSHGGFTEGYGVGFARMLGATFARVHIRGEDHACVAEATGVVEDEGVRGVLRLRAQRGQLVGTYDDGRSLTTVSTQVMTAEDQGADEG